MQWYIAAVKLATDMVAAFLDPQGGGFYDTRLDHENLLVRPRDIQDNATPSGGALATLALLQLSAYSGRGDWRDLAVAALSSVQQLAMRYPTGFACWLLATDFAVSQVKEAALIGSADDPRTMALESALWSAWRPRLVAAVSPFPPPPGSPELLNDRPMVANQPAAYICQQFACLVPRTSTEGLLASLD